MAIRHTATVIILVLLTAIARTAVAAVEIYHWLDENGVPNYSQMEPVGQIPDLNKLTLVDTTPRDYDPEENRKLVQARAERMSALRDKMEQRREAMRERRKMTAQQQLVQAQEPVRYYAQPVWYRPVFFGPHPKPHSPIEPQPQVVGPEPTATLKLPDH